MDSVAQWQQARAEEWLAAHPEVTPEPCPVEGTWHATVTLDRGWGYVHAGSRDELLAKLTAALGA